MEKSVREQQDGTGVVYVEEVKLMIEEMLGKVINVKSLAKALSRMGCEWRFKKSNIKWVLRDYEESEDITPKITIRKEISDDVLYCYEFNAEVTMLQVSIEIDYDVYIIPLKLLSLSFY